MQGQSFEHSIHAVVFFQSHWKIEQQLSFWQFSKSQLCVAWKTASWWQNMGDQVGTEERTHDLIKIYGEPRQWETTRKHTLVYICLWEDDRCAFGHRWTINYCSTGKLALLCSQASQYLSTEEISNLTAIWAENFPVPLEPEVKLGHLPNKIPSLKSREVL